MDDLVVRLRKLANELEKACNGLNEVPLARDLRTVNEAADEIERLRAEREVADK